MTIPATRAAMSRGDQTRESLLVAATKAFARDGYHAVSTRQIADLAQTNQALIGYHFGGKDDETREETNPAGLRDRLLPALLELTDGMAALLLRGDSAEWMQLILREQQTPTAAFDSLYSGFMGRVAALITEVAGRLRVDQEETVNRVLAATIIGQLVVFRSAHAGVMRHLGWAEIDDARIARVQQVLRGNVTALLTPPQA